jgi:hypothetical protein
MLEEEDQDKIIMVEQVALVVLAAEAQELMEFPMVHQEQQTLAAAEAQEEITVQVAVAMEAQADLV